MRWFTRTFLAAVLAAALAPPVTAEAPVTPVDMTTRVVGVDVMTATVLQEVQSSFSGLGLRMRIHSPVFVRGLEFMPTIEYWRNSNSVQPFDISTTRKDATLALDTRYVFGSSGFRPYIGAGYGLHFLSSSVNAPALGLNDESRALTKGGLAALGGASFSLAGRIENFIEIKYHHVPGYRQLKINWGLTMKM